MNRNVSSTRMSQESFEMYAALACSLHERLRERQSYVNSKKTNNNAPVVGNIDEAYAYHDAKEEVKRIEAEMVDLAAEMVADGMPLHVWVRLPGEGQGRRLKLRVFLETSKPEKHTIKIEEG